MSDAMGEKDTCKIKIDRGFRLADPVGKVGRKKLSRTKLFFDCVRIGRKHHSRRLRGDARQEIET